MQISNGRKVFYITVSILIAFIFWFYVNSGAAVDLTINEIPVEFFNGESVLANKGLMLVSGNDATVDLVLNMPRSLVYGFDVNHVRLIADLGSVNATGTQQISYSIIYPPGINPSQVSVKSPSVRNVSVQVGSLFRRSDVEIRCKLVGSVANGYVAGRVQIQPETLEIWGQQSDVMQVSYAQVTLNIQNARSTITEFLDVELYDQNDQLIENKGIHSDSSTISVTMPVIAATDIPLVVRLNEDAGVRVESFDYQWDTPSITLSGDASTISQIKELVLGEIDLAEIEDEKSMTYDIPVPDGVTNLSGVTSATLTIKNREVATRSMTVTQFDCVNFGADERDVEVVTSTLDVTLRGRKDDLTQIDPENVRAVADLSDVIDASGSYTVPVTLEIDGNPDVGTVQSYQVTVRIYAHGERNETEPEQENTGEAENEGEGQE